MTGKTTEVIAIEDLVAPETNVRRHSDKQVSEFVRSLEMFGQIRPVVIDENNVVLAGNGLVEALTVQGKDTAEVLRYTGLTENQKRKLMIVDNKIFELGMTDMEGLTAVLEELDGDLDVPGFEEDVLQALVGDLDKIEEDLGGYGQLEESTLNTIKNNAERKEEHFNAYEEQRSNHVPEQSYEEDEGEEEITPTFEVTEKTPTAGGETVSEKRAFVECPNCGEKIWLS